MFILPNKLDIMALLQIYSERSKVKLSPTPNFSQQGPLCCKFKSRTFIPLPISVFSVPANLEAPKGLMFTRVGIVPMWLRSCEKNTNWLYNNHTVTLNFGHRPLKLAHRPLKLAHRPLNFGHRPLKLAHRPLKLVHRNQGKPRVSSSVTQIICPW